MNKHHIILPCILLAASLSACQTADKKSPAVQQMSEVSYELVEQKLRAGMHRNQIVSTLGSPKVIQNGARPGEKNKEIWLFDIKVKDIAYTKNSRGQEEVLLKFVSDPYAKVPQKVGTIEVKFNQRGRAESIIYTVKTF